MEGVFTLNRKCVYVRNGGGRVYVKMGGVFALDTGGVFTKKTGS